MVEDNINFQKDYNQIAENILKTKIIEINPKSFTKKLIFSLFKQRRFLTNKTKNYTVTKNSISVLIKMYREMENKHNG